MIYLKMAVGTVAYWALFIGAYLGLFRGQAATGLVIEIIASAVLVWVTVAFIRYYTRQLVMQYAFDYGRRLIQRYWPS